MASAQATSASVADYIAKYQASNSRPVQSSTQDGGLKITKLPTEVLVQITGYLIRPWAACFTLCCREIYTKLGTKAFSKIRRAKPQTSYYDPRPRSHRSRELFFFYFERDFLHLFYCYYCDKLHETCHPDAKDSHRMHGSRACCQGEGKHNCQSHLNYSRVQMLMKRSRTGLDVTKELQAMTETRNLHRGGWPCQITIVPRISGSSFITRTQHWILIDSPGSLAFPWFVWRNICPHHLKYNSWYRHQTDVRRCNGSHREDSTSFETCRQLIQCDECDLEFCIDTQRLEVGLAIRITVWEKRMDLCFSPFNGFWEIYRRDVDGDRIFDEPGKIRDAFDSAGGKDQFYAQVRPDGSFRAFPSTPCRCPHMKGKEHFIHCSVCEHEFPSGESSAKFHPNVDH